MSKRKAYVIGTKVNTSLSPAIFQYWFDKFNISGEYGYIEIKENNFDKEIQLILKDKNLTGLNITTPYKEKIISHLGFLHTQHAHRKTDRVKTHLSGPTKIIGAVNWINRSGTKPNTWNGNNSDWFGFGESLRKFDQEDRERKNIAIVIGYGGASKAIIYSLNFHGYKKIKLFNRTHEKIKNKFVKTPYDHRVEIHELENLEKHIDGADIIINTTPINVLNKSKEWNIPPGAIGFDVVYRPKGGTGFLNHFKPNRRLDGIYMLINQAIPCFTEWFSSDKQEHKFETDARKSLYGNDGLINFLYKKMEEDK